MRGGGRRSPPLTRKTSGGEVPHYDHQPARVNAGYNAVNRGVDGKFVSCLGSSNVQKMVAALNDRGLGSLDGGLTSMEKGNTPSTLTPDAGDGADSGSLEGRQQPHDRGDVLGMLAMEAEIRREVASSGLDPHLPSSLDPSPPSPAAGVASGGMEVEKLNASPMCTTAVCINVNNNNSCTGAGNDDRNTSNTMDVGCDAPRSKSPTHPPPLEEVRRCSDDEEMAEPSSFPARNVAVQQRDSKLFSCNKAVFTAWSKPGVSPLPSLKDLPHLQPLDGAARLDEDEVNAYISRFDGALVGRLFGRHIPFTHLNVELQRRWDRFGSFKLMTLSNECFICFFESIKARDAVLMGGPWTIAGQVIGLDRWTTGFSPSTSHGFITPVWVRFPELPFYCWGMKNLASISSLLGEPLWVDDATLNLSKGSYARVCIKIDLSQPLLPHISVIGKEGTFQQQVEYEGLSAFCSKCGRVGHKVIHCNPTLAAGGRVDVGKTSHRIMNKAKNIGRASIFAFSATNNTATSTLKGKAAAHQASCSKNVTPTPTWKPSHVPETEEDQSGAGPWKTVPPRRRGRRTKQRQMQENAAVHVTNSSPPSPVHHQMQVQEAELPPTHMDDHPTSLEEHLGASVQQHDAEIEEVQQEDRVVSTPPFVHSRGNFKMGKGFRPRGREAIGKPQRGHVFHTPLDGEEHIDRSGKYKKRKSATLPDDEDAASFRPP